MDEQALYNRNTLSRLVHGMVFIKSFIEPPGRWRDAEGHWAELRATTERTGDINAEGWLEVLDLELAIAAMRGDHPAAASVVALHLMGFEKEDLTYIRNYDRLLDKGTAWLQAYLSGRDPEAAYRRRPSRRDVA